MDSSFDLIVLEDPQGHFVADWFGMIPNWLATYLLTLPNKNAAYLYRLRFTSADGQEIISRVPPGILPIEINHILILHGFGSD